MAFREIPGDFSHLVTIGGSNGIIGALISLLLGLLDVAGKYYAPSIGAFIIYGVMVVTLSAVRLPLRAATRDEHPPQPP